MTPKQKRTLVISSIIGTLFACYDEKEKTKLHKELHNRIGKGIRAKVKQYGAEIIVEIAHRDGNGIWKQAVDHFAAHEITIEASSCILALVNLDERALSRDYGLSRAKLGQWGKPSRREDRVELEKASNEVAKFVYASINTLYNIEVAPTVSILERIRLINMERTA